MPVVVPEHVAPRTETIAPAIPERNTGDRLANGLPILGVLDRTDPYASSPESAYIANASAPVMFSVSLAKS